MYAGMTVQPSGNPGMSGASPIPQQWWDQESGGGGVNLSDPHATSAGMNASSKSFPHTAAESPILAQRMGGMALNDTRVHSYGRYDPNADSGTGAPARFATNPPQQKGPTVNGLIRISLKKPMGIVFEPMEDPHNRYQQRGVRICELPRTGAAAMSGMLDVGDELLSINNKPMSRLKFDEIMDVIIDADAENVDLLFRRPKKEKSDKIADGNKNTSTTIKWDDNLAPPKDDYDEETMDESLPRREGRRQASPKRRNDPRDEESLQSGDDTFYTEQTSYTEDTRKDTRRGRRRGRNYHSESFLDMLIDTVCAPVMGGDGGRGDFSDDETFNSMDDRTYDSGDGDSFLEKKKKMWQESRKRNTEKLRKSIEDEQKKKKKAERETSRSKKFVNRNAGSNAHDFESNENEQMEPEENVIKYNKPQNPEIINVSDKAAYQNQMNPPSPPTSPPPLTGSSTNKLQSSRDDFVPTSFPENNTRPSSRFMPQVENFDTVEQDLNIPFKEITYDDQVEEQVSVMESVGGPSLLLENLRNAAQMKKTVDEELIQKFGKDFKPDLGLTRDESIQLNPDRFYRFAVKKMLEQNEPEKVRLIDKLFDKYRGREEHLIRKLDARYAATNIDNKDSVDKGKSESTDSGYDGFKAFGGGDGSKSSSGELDCSARDAFGADPWQSHQVPQFQTSQDRSQKSSDFGEVFQPANEGEDDNSSYSESEDVDSLDGTSPEVIAQVSELLNYVYGKTTVAGQIDRVSTIMRAYEGREAILLELLETKALIKANSDKGNLEDLPESLRNNPGLEKNPSGAEVQVKKGNQEMMSPISNVTGPSTSQSSSMIPNSSPAQLEIYDQVEMSSPSPDQTKKKKKGLFKGIFKRKNKETSNSGGGAFPTAENGKRRSSKKGALLANE